MKRHSNKITAGTAAVSLKAVTELLQLPQSRILAPFRRLYQIDHSVRPYLVAISTVSNFILSEHSYTLTRPAFVSTLYRCCGFLTGLNYTFTAYILDPMARPLVKPLIIDDDDNEARDKLDRWGLWNTLRADCTLGLSWLLSMCAEMEFDIFQMLSTKLQWE